MSDDKNGVGEEGKKLLYCSFCGKSQHEVRKLIAGPSVFVCDECVELCNDIIREELQESAAVVKIKNYLPRARSMRYLMSTWWGRREQKRCSPLRFIITING